MARIGVIALAALLGGCHWLTRTVEVPVEVVREVRVEVWAMPEPPPELLTPIQPPAGIWLHPGDAAASSCLAPGGEAALRHWVDALIRRAQAWEAWALGW